MREKWNKISDAEISKKSANHFSVEKSSFGKINTKIFILAYLHDFKCSTLGCFYDNVTTTQPSFLKDDLNLNNKNELCFRFFTSVECKIELSKLISKKPSGPLTF